MLSFIDPIKRLLSGRPTGNTRAMGCPLFVITRPCVSSSSRTRRHFALNSVAEMVFTFDCMNEAYHVTGDMTSGIGFAAIIPISEWQCLRAGGNL